MAGARAIGAIVVSDPANLDEIVATQKLPQGEFWYVYQASSGNSEDRGSFTLTTVAIVPFNQEVQLQAMKAALDTAAKCANAPWVVKQFPQYKVDSCDNRIWDIVPIDLPGGHKDLVGARAQVSTPSLTRRRSIPISSSRGTTCRP